MIIRLENIGPISEFEFNTELDLTLFYGKNSVGKSYGITMAYFILKYLGGYASGPSEELAIAGDLQDHAKKLLTNTFTGENPPMGKSLDKEQFIQDYESGKLNGYFTQEALEEVPKALNGKSFVTGLASCLKNSYGSLGQLHNKRATGINARLIIQFSPFTLTLYFKNEAIVVGHCRVMEGFTLREESSFSYSAYSKNAGKEPTTIEQFHHAITQRFYDILFVDFYNTLYRNLEQIADLHFLPASRSGIYQGLSGIGQIVAQLSQYRHQTGSVQLSLPALNEAVSDFFITLSSIDKESVASPLKAIVNQFESNLLQGTLVHDAASKRFYFEQVLADQVLRLELGHTSSMTSELALILAYFKFIVSAGETVGKQSLVFIEEPEAHLHPETQVMLMDLLAELAKAGIKIVLTTHSDYMFNKLNNLLLEGKIAHMKVGSYLMRMTAEGSVLDAEAMKANADGMNDANFGETAEALYNERLRLFDEYNNKIANAN